MPRIESHPVKTLDLHVPRLNTIDMLASSKQESFHFDLSRALMNQQSRLALSRSVNIPLYSMRPTALEMLNTSLRSIQTERINPIGHLPCTDLRGNQIQDRKRDVEATNNRFPTKLHRLLLDLECLPEGITSARFLPDGMAFYHNRFEALRR